MLGTIICVTATGTWYGLGPQSYDYDAFGNELNPDPNDTNPFRYCGEYYDTSTGLYNLQVRHYSPELGRFTQEDTHAGDPKNPLSLNLYTYCYNDPVQYDDPSGNVPVDTILDFISLCDSAVALCTAPSLAGVAMVALDLAALLLPYVSGTYILKGGKFVEAGEYLDEAVDTVKKADRKPSSKPIESKQSSAGTTSSVIGKRGEQWLIDTYGGESQVFFKASRGNRFIDQLADGIAHESKVGYTTMTVSIKNQVLKDAELINLGEIDGAHWHFFKSEATGKIGASKPLLEFLESNGIKYTIHNQ